VISPARVWHCFFDSRSSLETPELRRRRRLLNFVLVGFWLMWLMILSLIPLQISETVDVVRKHALSTTYPVYLLVMTVFAVTATLSARRGRYTFAARTVVLATSILSFAELVTIQDLRVVDFALIPVVLCGILLSRVDTVVMYAITFVAYLLVPTLIHTAVMTDMVSILVITTVVGAASFAAASSRVRSLKQMADQAETLERNRDLLVDQRKMEAVARISAGMGHEFKDILRSINDHAESIERGPDDSTVEIAKRVLHSSGRADRIADQLLSFSEQLLLNPASVEIGTVVKEHEEKLRSALRPGIALDLRNSPEPKMLRIDTERFCEAIGVLVRKAAESIPEEGTITIQTRTVNLQEGDDNKLQAPGMYCKFMIGNGGPGPTHQKGVHMFEPFFTFGEFGTGDMNLAAAYGIIRQSGGSVELGFDPALGSVFAVMVPIDRSGS